MIYSKNKKTENLKNDVIGKGSLSTGRIRNRTNRSDSDTGFTTNKLSRTPDRPESLTDLVIAYKEDEGNRTLADKLAVRYESLGKYIAKRFGTKLPQGIEPEDLFQAGYFGFLDAISDFDPNRGVKFETYSALRIRGAMLDYLRETDWVPRLVRAQTKDNPESVPTISSINRTVKVGDDDTALKDLLEDRKTPPPSNKAETDEFWQIVKKQLSKEDYYIFRRILLDGAGKETIGSELNLSESRVSQRVTHALIKLKELYHRTANGTLKERGLRGYLPDKVASPSKPLKSTQTTESASVNGLQYHWTDKPDISFLDDLSKPKQPSILQSGIKISKKDNVSSRSNNQLTYTFIDPPEGLEE